MIRHHVPATLVATLLATVPAPAAEPIGIEERVRVTATRLGDSDLPLERTAAHVTVIDREAIERSGAATVQELLATVAGATVFDQVGNGVETTFDLRGFSGGTGVRVFVDGAPFNASRNNVVELELLPPAAIERIEIHRGSAAAVAGAGAQAGVVRITTRRAAGIGGAVRLAAGSDDAVRADAELFAAGERAELFVVAGRGDDDGFRENAGGELERLAASLGVARVLGGRLSLSATVADSRLGNPGSLPLDEFEAGRRDAPFNRLDASARELRQLSVGWARSTGRSGRIDVNVFARSRDAQVLSTGRAAPTFGGFFLDSAADEAGIAAQWTVGRTTIGGEWHGGTTDALGWFTSPAAPAAYDRSSPSSANATDRTAAALFVDRRWRVGRWALDAGARWDDDELRYRDAFDATAAGSRTYDELSLRAGLSVAIGEGRTVRAAWGEGFLPPTVEQLFAFPLFGSNPELRPEDSTSVELGFGGRWTDVALDVALFRVETDDEIVFAPGEPPSFVGRNVNAGRARRDGVEIALDARLGDRVALEAALTGLDASFRGGASDGRELPLAPSVRASVALRVALGAGVDTTLRARHVGQQVLDNDETNGEPPLDAYTVVDLRVGWTPGGARPAAPWTLFAELSNALDEAYATRGIRAFDFQTFADETFVTPAPGRRWRAGFTRRF